VTNPSSGSSPAQVAAAGPVAVFVLDDRGRVLMANAAARMLWKTGENDLAGGIFAGLFAFDIVSQEADFLDAQWDVLASAATGEAIALQAQPREGDPREVLVQLEKIGGAQGGYFATVAPVASTATAPVDSAIQALSLLVNRSALGFFDLDFKGNRIHYTPAWKKLLGYVDAELPNTYDTWLQLLHPDDSGAAPDKFGKKSASAGPRPFAVEFRMKHRLGRWVWIQCLGVQIFGDDGALERVVGLHLDISERKEIEEATLANDERLRVLSADGQLGAFEIDFHLPSCWIAPAWKSLVGYDEDELPDTIETFQLLLPPEETEGGLAAWFAARGTIGAASFIDATRLRHKDGRWIPVVVGAYRQYTRKHELMRVVGFCCAVPETIAAIQAGGPALSPAMLTETFAALAEAVLVADAKGQTVFLNPVAARLLRLRPEELLGKPAHDVFHLVNRQSGEPTEDDACAMALSADGPLPLINQHALAPAREGEAPLPIVWTARAIFNASGRPEGVVIVFRNPDEMNLTPEELVKANRFESLGLLAGGIAHDFNNLLTTILGGVSLAKDNHDYSALDDSEKSCLAAKALTKQLLAFAKGSAGTQSVVSPGEILNDAVRVAAAGATAEVSVEVQEGISPVQVDRSQILQVFQNLVVNALQAMPPPPHRGRISLHAANTMLAEGQMPPLAAGAYVTLEVRDNASGIKPEHLERIWDPFFTTKKHGTGLGLATVLSIVRKHGGQIGVGSELGLGTVFTVFLPVADKPVEVQARRAPSLRFGTGRVLFMDDDPKICSLTATMLQSLDYKFDIARNGEEAVKFYRSYFNIGRPYDAVIMDITVIGGMGGEETFHVLKALDPDVRAIVSSGYDNEDMARRFLDLGFCGYLTKPYRVTELGKVLKAVLG
jgi:two-component system, cell cycle sensor histidine kinase and response regulator CckA